MGSGVDGSGICRNQYRVGNMTTQRTVAGFEKAIERAQHIAQFMGSEGRQVIKVLDIVLQQASDKE